MGIQSSSTSTSPTRTILVAAADEPTAETLCSLLAELDYQVLGKASTGAEAIDLARELSPDLVLLEVTLGGDIDGIAAATAIHDELAIASVFLSSPSDGIRLARAKRAQPAGYLFKPDDLKLLHCTLEIAFSKVDLQRELDALKRKSGALDEQREHEFDRVRRQLFDSKKMEVVGSLTGIIAHDINNMLLPIVGYSNLLVDALGDEPELSKMAGEIREAASGSTALTNQLLAFSRRQALEKEVVDINELVEESERMLRCLVGNRVALHLELGEGGVHGNVSPGQIEQAILNLCVNSADAMAGDGSITLKTELLGTGQDRLPEALQGSTHRNWMCLSVSDNGRGMRSEVCEQILEPYFTTKANDGAGLGLSVAYDIVSQHGGLLEVESLPGVGTDVRIYLPAEHALAVVEEKPQPRTAPVGDLGGTEKILVIEDEPQVRAFVACALKNKGYDIQTAHDLASARKVLSESREFGGFDLILSDCVLPDGIGVDCLVEQLREFPETKAILTTGYSVKENLLDAVSEYDIGFLQKPYPLPKLFEIVRQVLDKDVQLSA